MERARTANLVEFAPQSRHAVANHPPVGLDLRLARAAEEAEAAALAFEVGPAAHQAALLVVEVRQLDLQAPFGGRCALAEYLEDQPGAVDHLALELLFQIALLDSAQRAVDNHQLGVFHLAIGADALDLAFAEQRRRAHLAQRQHEGVGDDEADRQGKPLRLLEPRFGLDTVACAADVRANHQGARTARDFAYVVIDAQAASPSSSSQSLVRSTGAAGWIVDTACL